MRSRPPRRITVLVWGRSRTALLRSCHSSATACKTAMAYLHRVCSTDVQGAPKRRRCKVCVPSFTLPLASAILPRLEAVDLCPFSLSPSRSHLSSSLPPPPPPPSLPVRRLLATCCAVTRVLVDRWGMSMGLGGIWISHILGARTACAHCCFCLWMPQFPSAVSCVPHSSGSPS